MYEMTFQRRSQRNFPCVFDDAELQGVHDC